MPGDCHDLVEATKSRNDRRWAEVARKDAIGRDVKANQQIE
jgi:hypothetical protein